MSHASGCDHIGDRRELPESGERNEDDYRGRELQPSHAAHSNFRAGRKLGHQIFDGYWLLGIGDAREADHSLGDSGVLETLQRALWRPEPVDGGTHRALRVDLRCHALFRNAQMLRQKPIAKVTNCAHGVRPASGLEQQIALAVESHRAVADVRGTDAQPFVIDDRHL